MGIANSDGKHESDPLIVVIEDPETTNVVIRDNGDESNDIGDEDEVELRKMGYRQELYRGFSAFMAFSFCFTAVAVISSLTGLFTWALKTGGPAVIVWSWIIGSALTVCTTLSMAEICSTYPSAGSVYHWAGVLSKPESAALYAYITGWFNFVGNVAADAFFSYAFASTLRTLLVLTGQRSMTESGEEFSDRALDVILGIGITGIWSLQNLLRIDFQGWINNAASLWQLGSTLAIVGTLFFGCNTCLEGDDGDKGCSANLSDIFFTYYNETGFESPVYVVLVGMLAVLYSFTGYEAAAHMSEETKKARITAPYGIVYTSITTAVIGFLYLLGLLYRTAHRVSEFLSSPDEGAILDVFGVFQGCRGKTLATVFCAVILSIMYFSGSSSLCVTSRIGYAMARDGAFPASKWIRTVHSGWQTPVGSIALVFLVNALLISLNLVNNTAFLAVTSIAAIGYQISYAIPIYLRVTHSRDTFAQSDFHLGPWGVVCGTISTVFLILTSILFLLPTRYPITLLNMNYTALVLALIAIVGSVHWQFSAKTWFTGPHRRHAQQTL